jgi:hypothetical protein
MNYSKSDKYWNDFVLGIKIHETCSIIDGNRLIATPESYSNLLKLEQENKKLETQLKETQYLLIEACGIISSVLYDYLDSCEYTDFLNKPEIKQLLEQRKIDERTYRRDCK